MILNHVAAILLFSGPLFYVGLFLVVDPADAARVVETAARMFRKAECNQPPISTRFRNGLRLAGMVLLVFAIAL